tara:strand:+ start:235 stop:609 length:375 start_codon:yes stop_codon:yes gene_type:complete
MSAKSETKITFLQKQLKRSKGKYTPDIRQAFIAKFKTARHISPFLNAARHRLKPLEQKHKSKNVAVASGMPLLTKYRSVINVVQGLEKIIEKQDIRIKELECADKAEGKFLDQIHHKYLEKKNV